MKVYPQPDCRLFRTYLQTVAVLFRILSSECLLIPCGCIDYSVHYRVKDYSQPCAMWCLFGTVSSESLLTTCGCVDCSVPDRVKVYLQHVSVSPIQEDALGMIVLIAQYLIE